MPDLIAQLRDGRTDRVFDLLAQGFASTSTDPQGVPLIRWCAYHGDVSAVRFLLSHGESLATLGENLDLNGAAFHGHWQLCQFLLEQGASVHFALPDTGETPLHAALCKANWPVCDHIVALLLAHEADPDRPTIPGIGTDAFMRDIRTRGETPLHRAAAFASERTIQLLLDAGANRQARDAHGETPLTWASWHLRPAAILRLLCYGRHAIHPGNQSTYDHGAGHHPLDPAIRTRPHL